MKKSSRFLALLLIMCLLLAGCGQGQTPEAEAPGEAPEMSAELEGELAALSEDVIDPDLTCTITPGQLTRRYRSRLGAGAV